MGDTTTPIMQLVKPAVGASRSTWGNKWNGNADGIETYCTNLFAEITALQQQVAALEAQMVNAAVPIGTVIAWPENANWPAGYLNTDGSLWPVASFPQLFARLGTHYGGDGVNTFGVPDFRGCVLAAMDQGTGRLGGIIADVPGAIGGEPWHVLNWEEMPVHNHTGWTDWEGNHQHWYWSFNYYYYSGSGDGWPDGFYWGPDDSYQETDVEGDHYHALQVDASGGGYAHNNLQVTALVVWLIRAV